MSENNKGDPPKTSKPDEDKELADLLDSALSDFNNTTEEKSAAKNPEEKAEIEKNEGEDEDEPDVEWSQEFVQAATQQFQEDMARLCAQVDPNVSLTPEQIQESFQKMAEAAQHVLANPAEAVESNVDFSSAITQTIRGLSEGTENLQNPFSEQDLVNMFSGGAAGGAQQNGFLPFMQGMMQSLLSKDVLYPSLKDILDKFPDWLQANAASLPQEDRQRYESQKKLMEDICKELEGENESDSAEVKRERFEKVLGLMQKLQDYGQPPTDLVGDVGPGLPFDPSGNPEQCSIM